MKPRNDTEGVNNSQRINREDKDENNHMKVEDRAREKR